MTANPAPALRPPAVVPVLALGAAALGTGLALMLMPVDVTPPGAMRLSSTVQAVGLLVGPALMAASSLRLLMRVECLLSAGLVYWVLSDVIQGRYGLEGTNADGAAGAVTAVGLFACGLWGVFLLPAPPLPTVIRRATALDITPRLLLIGVAVCFLFGMFHYAYTSDFDPSVMADGLTKGRFDTPWMRFRIEGGQYGGSWLVVIEQLGNFGLLLPCLTVLTARRCGLLSLPTATAAAGTVVYLPFVIHSGNRRVFGAAVAAALLVHILTAARIRGRDLAVGVVGLAALGVALEYTIAIRSAGRGIASVSEGEVNAFGEGFVVRVDDNFLRLAQVTTLFPRQYDYLYAQRFWFTVTRPVPRVLWPGKPTDPGFDLTAAVGLHGLSLSASVVADWYMAGGYVAVLLGGMAFGLAAGVWDRLLRPRMSASGVVVYALGLMVLFVGLRSADELVFQSYPLLSWLALSNLIVFLAGRRGDP